MAGQIQVFSGNYLQENSSFADCALAPGVQVETIDTIDPFETAYLREGEREVTKLVLFDLVERGYLEIRTTSNLLWSTHRLIISPHHPALEKLSQAQRELLDRFAEPRKASEILTMPLPAELATACRDYKDRLTHMGFISGSSDRNAGKTYTGLLIVIGLFIAVVVHPFAAFMIVAGLAILLNRSFGQRLTAAGKQELAQRKAAFDHLRNYPKLARFDIHDPALLPLVGALGPDVLVGSVYDAFPLTIRDNSALTWEVSVDGCGADGCGGCGGCGD